MSQQKDDTFLAATSAHAPTADPSTPRTAPAPDTPAVRG